MTSNPYFGIVLSFITYEIGMFLNKKFNNNPIVNPLLISIILCIAFLKIFNITYEDYMNGAKYIAFLIAPSTVALVTSLYKNLNQLKTHLIAIIVGVTVGVIVALSSILILCKLLNLNEVMIISIFPKSITTAIGVPLAEEYGGYGTVTVLCIILTGVLGAVIAPYIKKVFKVEDKVAMGLAIGTSAHAVGTSKAIEMGEIEGAMSGLSIGVAGVITAIIMPIFIKLI